MSDFLDKNLLQNLISGIIVMFVGFLFVGKNVNVNKASSGKFWKSVIIISVLAMFSGFYLFVIYFSEEGLDSAYVNIGLLLFILGYIFKKIGKFLNWWNN